MRSVQETSERDYQSRFRARVELLRWDPQHEIDERRPVRPEDFLHTLSWGSAPTAAIIEAAGAQGRARTGAEILMPIPAELMAERAASWAESDAAVRAMIVYGCSLAQGSADEGSDLDVIIVAEPGQRDALWDRREQISDLIHGGHHAIWHQEPLWQRPYRYQSWDEKLAGLDLTLDEEHAGPRPPRLSPRSCAVPCGQQRSCTHGLSTDGRSAPGSQCRETR